MSKSAVNSQAIINQVLKMKEERSEVDMCEALQRWWDEAVGKGREEGIVGTIKTCKKFHISEEETLKNLMEEFALSEQKAQEYMKKYWN